MRQLALLVALIIVAIGIVGVVAPDRLIDAGQYVLTPFGLYAIAALRIGMGLVLMWVVQTSRTPKTLRALGAVGLRRSGKFARAKDPASVRSIRIARC